MSTGLASSAVVEHVNEPVTPTPAGVYVIAGSEDDRPLRFSSVLYSLFELTAIVNSGVVMMLPLLAIAMKQLAAEQAAPLICVIPVGPTFSDVVGPLIGLPCNAHVAPPSEVATTVPIAPPAKQ